MMSLGKDLFECEVRKSLFYKGDSKYGSEIIVKYPNITKNSFNKTR